MRQLVLLPLAPVCIKYCEGLLALLGVVAYSNTITDKIHSGNYYISLKIYCGSNTMRTDLDHKIIAIDY